MSGKLWPASWLWDQLLWVILILSLFDSVQFDLEWLVLLAAAGLLIMLAMMAVLSMAGRPRISGLLSRTMMQGKTLKKRLSMGFRVLAILPLLTALPMLAVISSMKVRDSQVPQIERLAVSLAESVPQLVEGRVSGIEALAGHISAAGSPSPAVLSATLLRHHRSSREFASLWIAERNGDVVAASAINNGRVSPWEGPAAGVAMMNSFKRAVMNGGLYISPVTKGAASEGESMMFVSAPISLNGVPNWGFVQGLLSVSNLAGALVNQGSPDSVAAIITDESHRVILQSPGLAIPQFGEISGHPLKAAADLVQPGQDFVFSGIVNNDGNNAKYIAVSQPMSNGWQVYATATQASANITLLLFFAVGLVWTLLSLMMANRLSPLYGEVVAQPLQKLEESLENFDAARTVTIMPPAPKDTPREIRQAFARVRESMQHSRQQYRNMLKVVNEGIELRQQLGKVNGSNGAIAAAEETGSEDFPDHEQTDIADHIAQEMRLSAEQVRDKGGEPTTGKTDPVTGLATLPVFEVFFGEAWALSMSDSRPVGVLLVRVAETDDGTLKRIGRELTKTASRTLDLVARIAQWEYGLVLPDTDLNGGLAVAERLAEILRDVEVQISFGVASIVPNEKGNAKSFLDISRRAVAAAQQEGDRKIAFVSDRGKLMLHQIAAKEPAQAPEKDPYLIEWEDNEEASA